MKIMNIRMLYIYKIFKIKINLLMMRMNSLLKIEPTHQLQKKNQMMKTVFKMAVITRKIN